MRQRPVRSAPDGVKMMTPSLFHVPPRPLLYAAWWLYARHFEDTDDAFIDARTVALSSQVTGMVTEVDVTDNQQVFVNDSWAGHQN